MTNIQFNARSIKFGLSLICTLVLGFGGTPKAVAQQPAEVRLTGDLPTWKLAFGGLRYEQRLMGAFYAYDVVQHDIKTKKARTLKAWVSSIVLIGIPFANGIGLLGTPWIGSSVGETVVHGELLIGVFQGFWPTLGLMFGTSFRFTDDLSSKDVRRVDRNAYLKAKEHAEKSLRDILNNELTHLDDSFSFREKFGTILNLTLDCEKGMVTEFRTSTGLTYRTQVTTAADIKEVELVPQKPSGTDGPDVDPKIIIDLEINALPDPTTPPEATVTPPDSKANQEGIQK